MRLIPDGKEPQPQAVRRDVILDIRDLTVALPAWADRSCAVSNVSISLQRDEILCVVGESGSGKSLLSRAIMGLLPPPHVRASGGQIMFGGKDLLTLTPTELRDIRGKCISMVFQEPMTAFNPLKTIGNQIEEVILVHERMPRRQRIERVLRKLEEVNLPDPDAIFHAYPHQISGGQRQRALIAMALVLEPAILIADEPTTALDVTTQAQILALMKRIQAATHMGILFITHDFGVVADIADRVAVMRDGAVVESGTANQVLNSPQHPYTRAMAAAVPRLQCRPPTQSGDAPIALSASQLTKTYQRKGGLFGVGRKAVVAVKDVSLFVRVGETLGVVGESGSGKSTLARCISRLVEADSGAIALKGADLRSLPRRQLRSFRRHVQMVFQDPYGSLDPRQRVRDLICEGPIVHGVGKREAIARADRLLELVGLNPGVGDRFPHEFSGGQRQRICLARALAVEPEVLIADEVVSALDVSVQAQVLKLLAEIKERLHLAMVFITHDLRIASQICDSIAVMRYGAVIEQGPTGQVFSNPQHPYTRELLAAVPGKGWHASSQIGAELVSTNSVGGAA